MPVAEPITERARHSVPRPVLFQDWNEISFIHWRYDPPVIAPHLPAGLTVDTFDGTAWVGLTPFILGRLRFPYLPSLPLVPRFPEMNVRTYVIGPDGTRGIWFFSLEAASLPAVLGGRVGYRLPYRLAKMNVKTMGTEIEYRSRRRIGKGRAEISVEIGAAIRPDPRELFLTARYRLFTVIGGHLAYSQVEHDPWPLRDAVIRKMSEDVVENSGLPAPTGLPIVHFSRGVRVRVGAPVFIA